jgi:hypothetical protein
MSIEEKDYESVSLNPPRAKASSFLFLNHAYRWGAQAGEVTMPRSTKGDSNLFAIDHDAIRSVLAEANRRLLDRRDELCSALTRVPKTLMEPDQIARANVFARQLQGAIQETRSSRLSDGRPFRDATATVKAFFDQIERPLQSAVAAMRERLTEAALRNRDNQISPHQSVSVGVDLSGTEIIASRTSPATTVSDETTIDLDWEVASVDGQALDLEALRHLFTDSCLMTACKRHLAAHGARSLKGVIYKETARAT